MSPVRIKPRMVQTTCLALMGPLGWLLCQSWDHPGCSVSLYWPDELPGSVGVWPDAFADDFGLKPAFRGPVAYEWRSDVKEMRVRGRRGEAVEPLSDRARMRTLLSSDVGAKPRSGLV